MEPVPDAYQAAAAGILEVIEELREGGIEFVEIGHFEGQRKGCAPNYFEPGFGNEEGFSSCIFCRLLWVAVDEKWKTECPACAERPALGPILEKMAEEYRAFGFRAEEQMRREAEEKEERKRRSASKDMSPELKAEIDRWERLTPAARKSLGLKDPRGKKRSKQENYEIDEVYAEQQRAAEEIADDPYVTLPERRFDWGPEGRRDREIDQDYLDEVPF